MSGPASALGAFALVSIVLLASAGTARDVRDITGSQPPTPQSTTTADLLADGQATTKAATGADRAGASRLSSGLEIITARSEDGVFPTVTTNVQLGISPRQERLVGLTENPAADLLVSDTTVTLGSSTTPWSDSEVPTSPLEPSTDSSETTMSTLESKPTTRATSTMTTTQANLIPGKSTGAKTRNDLVGFREIKPAKKVISEGYSGGKMIKPNVPSALGKYTPYFEDGQLEVNVTARIGNTVLLNCEIGMLGSMTVTWHYRCGDVIRLLTVGRNPYSVDQRISLFFRYPTNWRLKIQYATPRDSGWYECQVQTTPPLVKRIHLLVTAPILVIMDDSGRIESGERHLKAGSALHLRCEARDVPERYNETVIWTRGDEILNEDVSENRTTEYKDGREIQVIVSTIVVEKATPRHAGNYSCVVPEKAKATVTVHVLNGELPAAVHDGNGVSRSVLNLWLIHLTVSYVFSR